MTLSANKAPGPGKRVVVRTTYGPVTNEVIEDAQGARSFHTMLGQLLDSLEQETE